MLPLMMLPLIWGGAAFQRCDKASLSVRALAPKLNAVFRNSFPQPARAYLPGDKEVQPLSVALTATPKLPAKLANILRQ